MFTLSGHEREQPWSKGVPGGHCRDRGVAGRGPRGRRGARRWEAQGQGRGHPADRGSDARAWRAAPDPARLRGGGAPAGGRRRIAVGAVSAAANVVRRFVEGYHEKLEEEFVLPTLEKAGKLGDLTKVIRVQHAAGRKLTDAILKATKAGKAAVRRAAACPRRRAAELRAHVRRPRRLGRHRAVSRSSALSSRRRSYASWASASRNRSTSCSAAAASKGR